MVSLFGSIENMKQVGETRAKAYEKLGITSPYDLLFHYPRSYVDFTKTVKIADAEAEKVNVLCVRIDHKYSPQFIRKNFAVYKAQISDSSGVMQLVIYNNVYGFNALKTGMVYFLAGKVTYRGTHAEIVSPKVLTGDSEDKILPQYPLSAGLNINQVRNNMREAIKLMQDCHFEWMPQWILEKYNLCGLQEAIKQIHFPKDFKQVETAQKRLAFDEMMQLQLGMLMLKKRKRKAASKHIAEDTDIETFKKSLPFEMTKGQEQAVEDIKKDMCGKYPMNRLLQGDVGSGKTVVAAAACYMAFKNDMQSVLMAPTEILARQHFATLKNFLSDFGVETVLIVSSMPAKEKREAMEKAANGEADVIVGTNAVMRKKVVYKNIGLVITDEQHRFGVEQRNALSEKGESPHKLVMSATPIPRTLALMMYGELELSVIRELPSGRQPVETFAVTGKLRSRAFGFMKKEIDAGHQAYIICPLIEEGEVASDKKSVMEYTDMLKNIFPNMKIEALHGKMAAKSKDEIMTRYKNGEVDVLVSTTVVEVGVDVPNATVMIIEDAEKFGMSQLHQLRGRVGRGKAKSYCILVANKVTEDGKRRLKTLSSTTDGFKIAEEDLAQRGAGDFFGNRQHGLPPLKIADLTRDIDLFKQTREAAAELVAKDPELMQPENRGLKLEVLRMFAKSGTDDLD